MEHKFTEQQPLLDENGRLKEAGYATSEVLGYDRNKIAASKWRIKEWDYYCCMTESFAFTFTIADLGYLGLITVDYLDFRTKKEIKKSKTRLFPFGSLGLPGSADDGDVEYEENGFFMRFSHHEDHRRIEVNIEDFSKSNPLTVDLKLYKKDDDRMVIATPWKKKPKAFYYNQKINCQPTEGMVAIGKAQFRYDPAKHFSVLDWGRGVWPYKNTWYWGSLSGLIDKKRFGFNIGTGFGDTSQATENMIFYDGKAHKIGPVSFELDHDDVMKPWRFHAEDGRFDCTMTPLFDRQDDLNLMVVKNLGHQVFGRFHGTVTLDSGKILEIPGLLGFAEKITNHY
jgi:hypothetical protein